MPLGQECPGQQLSVVLLLPFLVKMCVGSSASASGLGYQLQLGRQTPLTGLVSQVSEPAWLKLAQTPQEQVRLLAGSPGISGLCLQPQVVANHLLDRSKEEI